VRENAASLNLLTLGLDLFTRAAGDPGTTHVRSESFVPAIAQGACLRGERHNSSAAIGDHPARGRGNPWP
jgi:hypothetical protein